MVSFKLMECSQPRYLIRGCIRLLQKFQTLIYDIYTCGFTEAQMVWYQSRT